MIFLPLSDVKFRGALALIFLLLMIGGCGSARVAPPSSGVDENLLRLNRSARIAYDNGQLEQAANLYHQALDRAYLRDDRSAIVDAQYNLAVCMLGLRSYAKALEWVHKAKKELMGGEQRISPDILLLEGVVLFRSGKSDQAWQTTDRILSAPESPPVSVKNKTHFLRGLIADQRGDTDQLDREINGLVKSTDPGMRADRAELAGRLAKAEGRWAAAIEAFDHAVRLRRDDLDYPEMAQALALAADAYHQAGNLSAAARHYYRAGRSAVRLGDNQNAIKWLDSAARLAGQAGDVVLRQDARFYLKGLQAP